jgi:hypothetical protein
MTPRPLQNRVTPMGAIIAHPARGRFMGNRGCLHDEQKRLSGRRWTTRAWICCALDFKGRKREVMAPRHYTELFFLDEATALAAGHRPCFECRRRDAERFRAGWREAVGDATTAAAMDDRLHAERLPDRAGRRRAWQAQLDSLPDGVFLLDRDYGEPRLLWKGRLHRWTPAGYDGSLPALEGARLEVLTPPALVAVLRAGYVPDVAPGL